ncbi:MAG: cysteine hydrolase [Oscillospiraceae bacterium]|nr:cysteine hydrolase [Oscillospiraceae bacterium]
MKKALIVIDMQNDFVDGALGSGRARAIVPAVRAKIAEYAGRGDLIIFTRDTHTANYLQTQEGRNLPVEHCIAGTRGWEIYDGLDNEGCLYIDKPSFGWCGWTYPLDGAEIELVGLCTGICVVSNALILKAAYPEAVITVDASCCACVSEESHRAALLTMRMCQVNVINDNS